MCKSTGSLILKQYRRGKNRRSRDLLKVWKKKRKSFVTSFISYCSSCAPFQFVLQPLQGSQGWKPMKGPTSINHRLRPSKVPLSKPSESHHLQGCCYCINSSGKWKQIFSPGLIETTSPEETLDVWLTWEKKKTHFSRIIITIIFCRRIWWYVTREGGRKLLSCKQNMKFEYVPSSMNSSSHYQSWR